LVASSDESREWEVCLQVTVDWRGSWLCEREREFFFASHVLAETMRLSCTGIAIVQVRIREESRSLCVTIAFASRAKQQRMVWNRRVQRPTAAASSVPLLKGFSEYRGMAEEAFVQLIRIARAAGADETLHATLVMEFFRQS